MTVTREGSSAVEPSQLVRVPDLVKVVFLGGQARSGSTLLDRTLGQVPGFETAGEVRYLFKRGLLRNELCGCGTPLHECSFWERVGKEAFGGWDRIDLGEVLWLQREVDRPGRLPSLMTAGLSPSFRDLLQRYGEYLHRVFLGIQRASGARVVIDSTMSPPYALALRETVGLDLRIVHLVRDPRGVAYSSGKKVTRPEVTDHEEYMPVYSPRETALRWSMANGVFEMIARTVPTVRVRYEDFVREPEAQLHRIAELAEEPFGADHLAFLDGDRIELEVDHTAAGNPMRFKTGTLTLRVDEDWRHKLDEREQRRVARLTSPLLHRYGYAKDGWAR